MRKEATRFASKFMISAVSGGRTNYVRVFIAIHSLISNRNSSLYNRSFGLLPLEAWVRDRISSHVKIFRRSFTQIHIISCMAATVQSCQPFSLSLTGIGVSTRISPRVLWVSVQDVAGVAAHAAGPRCTIDAGWLSIENRRFPPSDGD